MARHKHIYNGERWKRVRAIKLRMNPLCEYCPNESRKVATEVDHFIAISDGCDPYDLDNLRSTCASCHSSKTAHGERLHGCDESGWPRDPHNPWNAEKSL